MDSRRQALPHGQKRPPDDGLESEQRLSKRFNLLNIGRLPLNPWLSQDTHVLADQNGKLYLPVQRNAPTSTLDQNESMQLDDTKDKVYIHNLDAELADLESDEDTPIYLPDIEKKLAKIPRSVLMGRNPPITNNQMVLYNVPSSLSVPQEQDNVRRVIIESRTRAREKQAQEQEQKAAHENGAEVRTSLGDAADRNDIASIEDMDIDENAMDIG
ncbi:MAG: hypothetical protein LQ339_005073 [Xanthoria mediterranea]|nr:MAG: hypothetical protein LQ339_005073 [Xanthoria mediterranea]